YDRSSFPREKTCGEWLTSAALSELSLLGLDAAALAKRAPSHASVMATRLIAPDGSVSTRTSGNPGACIARRMLDHLVRERALAAGCEPLERAVRDIGAETALFADYDHV